MKSEWSGRLNFTVDGDLSDWEGLASVRFPGGSASGKGAAFYGAVTDAGLYLACDVFHDVYTVCPDESKWDYNASYFQVNLVNNVVGVYASRSNPEGAIFAEPSSSCRISRAVMKTEETGADDGSPLYHTAVEVFIDSGSLPDYYAFPGTVSVGLTWRTPWDVIYNRDSWYIRGTAESPSTCPLVATPTGLYVATNYGEYRLIREGKKKGSDPAGWKPVEYAATMPKGGVTLRDGVIKELFDKNIEYILDCYRIEGYCEKSRMMWGRWLPASNDARILAGAANSLVWNDDSRVNARLREIVDVIVARIKGQARDDGYFNYYPDKETYSATDESSDPDGIFRVNMLLSERKNYDRMAWTRGMIAAAESGNEDALPLVRAMYDWFESSPYLPYMLQGHNSECGFPSLPLVYHTGAGRQEDITVHQRYMELDYWLDQFIRREPEAFAYYPGRPHGYDLIELEALADEYRATGERRYLDALLGAWDIYREGYLHLGGITAICEASGPYPYKSYYITTGHTGETCVSVFWIWINGRLAQLYPSEEKYAAEMEKTLFNAILSCRDAAGNTRYHNRLQKVKDRGTRANTCCEVTSTMLISELPKYIYTEDEKGVWINLFVPSEIRTGGLCLETETQFPNGCDVTLRVKEAHGNASIRVRIPSWAAGGTEIFVNGKLAATGVPGTYAELEREWKSGDTVRFTHRMELKAVKYDGRDAAPNGHERYAMMYGPILLAVTGGFGDGGIPEIRCSPENLPSRLVPEERGELHFRVEGQPELRCMPYYEIENEIFCCYPTVSGRD